MHPQTQVKMPIHASCLLSGVRLTSSCTISLYFYAHILNEHAKNKEEEEEKKKTDLFTFHGVLLRKSDEYLVSISLINIIPNDCKSFK